MEDVQRRKGLYGLEFREIDGRRAPEGERKTPEIKALWQRSHEIINLAVRGFNNADIAKILNITPVTVSNTLNSELGELKLSDMRKERDKDAAQAYERIRLLSEKAMSVYNKIFENEGNKCSLEFQKETADTVMLELSGHRAPTKVQSQSVSMVMTAEELSEFKQRGIEAGIESGLVIEAEVKEVPNDG